MFPLFMTIVTFIIFIAFIVQPLFLLNIETITKDLLLKLLKIRKKVTYKQIKEAKMEYDMGNLLEENFLRTRNYLKKDSSELIQTIEKKQRKL